MLELKIDVTMPCYAWHRAWAIGIGQSPQMEDRRAERTDPSTSALLSSVIAQHNTSCTARQRAFATAIYVLAHTAYTTHETYKIVCRVATADEMK